MSLFMRWKKRLSSGQKLSHVAIQTVTYTTKMDLACKRLNELSFPKVHELRSILKHILKQNISTIVRKFGPCRVTSRYLVQHKMKSMNNMRKCSSMAALKSSPKEQICHVQLRQLIHF